MATKEQTIEGNIGESTTAGQTGTQQSQAGSQNIGSNTSGMSSTSGSTGMSSSSGGGIGAGTATARSLYDQAKETAGQAYEVAADKATTKLEEQKTSISGGLAAIAGSVRQVGENLKGPDVQDSISKFTADYSGLAAQKIENVANYFERKNVREMYSDLESFARTNPAVFVGGAFALGLLAARFLKSGARTNSGGGQSRQQLTGTQGNGAV